MRLEVFCRGDQTRGGQVFLVMHSLSDWYTRINISSKVHGQRDTWSTGFIALQVHGTKKERPMEVRWRNIRLAELAEE